MKSLLPLIFLLASSWSLTGQVNYNANDVVPNYSEPFRPGINPGTYNQWTDEQIADLAAGNPYLSIPGLGVKSIRPSLPENFLDVFGYDVRLGAFQYYENLDLTENVCFIGYPNLVHRDTNIYCQEDQTISKLFANMYLPIWDGGANGTPYNDDNYLAAYTYKVVTLYKDYVRFWEIWNEPSLDQSNYKATLPPGHPESWWVNDPEPCDMDIQAPVYHYIRMLRVCYDVIKTVDPDAFVTLGGVGYYSFFDVLCRNTDNPVDGSVTPEYPLGGGAYFDAVGIHTYPHFDGSTIFLSNGQLVYERHSDAAAEGIVLAKNGRQAILENYGYDGITYPKKEFLITEINVPRMSFQGYMGSPEAQLNFVTKALVTSMSNDIHQLHFYNLGDLSTPQNADSWFDVMGFYGNLSDTPPYTQEVNDAGIALKTASDLLFETAWDSLRSAQLNLPSTVGGGALKDTNGEYTYVLWAKTDTDNSEVANATYSFPTDLNISNLYRKQWDFSATFFEENISSLEIALDATPAFFTTTPTPLDTTDLDVSDCVEIVDGMDYMGQYLGSKYFKSNNQLTWEEAKLYCEARGGHLVEIDDFAENEFIRSQLSEPAFIGLSDSQVEGTLAWSNGNPMSFDNIDICNFCAPNTEANDYLMIHSWNGKWSFNSGAIAKNFIMEFDCLNDTVPNNNGSDTLACDDPVPGFSFIGELGGKQYFLSNGANNWADSRSLCQAQGGDLVIIDDVVENNFIQGQINEMTHIGLSDADQEGILRWVDGSYPTYENFDICSFCDGNDVDHNNVVIHPWNGGWSFATAQQSFRAIMERTCEDDSGGSGGCDANLTLNQPTQQSSTQLGANSARAVDGNTNGNFWADQSSSLTNWESQPWWQVDLGELKEVKQIEVWNRNDCCSGIFSNYYLLISNYPFSNTASLDDLLADPNVTNFFFDSEADRPTLQEINQTTRYVRIQLTGTSFLAITEVKIIGCEDAVACPDAGTPCDDNDPTTENDVEDGSCNCAGIPNGCPDAGTPCDDNDATTINDVEDGFCNCAGTPNGCPDAGTPCDDNDATTINDVEDGFCNCAGTPDVGNSGCMSTLNLATDQPANQSSTLTIASITGDASKAVDGNTNGTFFTANAAASSVAATNNESEPWWEVDLESTHLIEQINFFNRTDGADRSRNCYVLISNNPFTSSDLASARAEADYEYFISGLVGSPSEIFPNIEGRYIRIQMQGSGYLVIAEVEVIGCVAPSNFTQAIPNLLTFNATKVGQTSHVEWTMYKDDFVKEYQVEVSTNQTDFHPLQTVSALGGNVPHSYQVSDRKPTNGENFYRIKILQKDGITYYSPLRHVNFDIDFEKIHLYPNPTTDMIYVALRDFAGLSGRIEIYNSLGQKMTERTYESFPAMPVSFDTKELVNGMYSMVVKVDNYRRFAKKFLVEKL
ncbi:MAG: discoidin domain-containing protein [Bacteroidota bacterium]